MAETYLDMKQYDSCITTCSEVIKKALTIAIRYGCIRKQFKSVIDTHGGDIPEHLHE